MGGLMPRLVDAHRSQVRGFAPSRPALMQLDRLGNDQIRAIAAGLEPLAG